MGKLRWDIRQTTIKCISLTPNLPVKLDLYSSLLSNHNPICLQQTKIHMLNMKCLTCDGANRQSLYKNALYDTGLKIVDRVGTSPGTAAVARMTYAIFY